MLLRRPPDAPDLSDAELDALQEGHLAYMDELRASGEILVNGPFRAQSDESLRGLCILSTDVGGARELMSRDPSVAAGRMAADVFVWMMPPGLARFGAA